MIDESDYETPLRVEVIVYDSGLGYLSTKVSLPKEVVNYNIEVTPEEQIEDYLEEKNTDVEIVQVENTV